MARTAPSIRSVLWAAADTGGVAVLSMIALLVMARFIAPDQFGRASLASGVVLVVNLYVEGLLHDALIQKQDSDETHFRAAFWLVVLIGLGVFVVSVIADLALARTALHPLLQLMLVTAASLPFSGVNGVSNARLRRQFRYDGVAIPSVVAKLLSSFLGLGLAIAHWGAWALVIQFTFSVACQACLLMWRERWVPRFTLDFRPLRSIWAFAIPYAGMHTVVGVRMQAFASLVAAMMGFTQTGYLNLALRLTQTPQVMLQTALTNLGLPLLARRQDDHAAFEAAFKNFNQLVAISMAPLFIGLAACAPTLVPTLVGPQWTPSIAPLQIFALCAAAYLVRLPSALLLRALGKVRYSFLDAVFHIALTLAGVALLRPTSLIVASLLWAAPLVVVIPATWVLVARDTGVSVRSQMSGCWAPLAASAVMAAVVLWLQRQLAVDGNLVALVASVAAGGAVYVGLVLALDPRARALVSNLLARRGLTAT